ncbi:RNA polymerase epsilon subunit [Xylocopilactobacillus apicola]|uniref:UPF0356 protein n=1 Tax=Xylocopilactobacillus apicola TaxID=2932184 RepID=A0AAU9D435_9LACO|nr:RNA polymerase epsilon subunit [Xylocopilactobacillus apicola]BDR58243.1 UPF0356 protein [Xylocopilactobacillus apicola]
MIYKVYYQGDAECTPRRERTQTLYAEAASIPDLKKKIVEKFNYSIEYVAELNEQDLDYEKEHNSDFEVLKDL